MDWTYENDHCKNKQKETSCKIATNIPTIIIKMDNTTL